jgi:hypothetical protein
MMQGFVNQNYEAVISLVVKNVNKLLPVDAIIVGVGCMHSRLLFDSK